MPRRSLLFTPGSRREMLRTAPESGADVVVFDLEDAVGPGKKVDARETVASVLADQSFDPSCEVCVRVNPLDRGAADDLEVVLESAYPDSVMLPKATDADDVRTLERLLAEHDVDLPVIVLIETARAVLEAAEIADATATDGLFFGAEDLAADLGATRTIEGTEVMYARQHVVLAAAAAGVDAIDTIFPTIDDDSGLREEATRARRLGFDGKAAIHPSQVRPIEAAFTPDEEEVDWARRVLTANEEAEGDVFRLDGEMVDAPMVRRAERTVRLADTESTEDR